SHGLVKHGRVHRKPPQQWTTQKLCEGVRPKLNQPCGVESAGPRDVADLLRRIESAAHTNLSWRRRYARHAGSVSAVSSRGATAGAYCRTGRPPRRQTRLAKHVLASPPICGLV